jgi:hypothetical protein
VHRTELDNTAPMGNITSPVNGALLQNGDAIKSIIGNASDANFTNYSLDYRLSGSSGSWLPIITNASTPVQNTELGAWNIIIITAMQGTTKLDNGTYDIRLTVSDSIGNTTINQITVTLDYIRFSNVTNNKIIHPVDGEISTIQFDITRPALVTLKVYTELERNLVYEGIKNITSSGANTIAWNGTYTSGNYVPDEAYVYYISADDGIGTATYNPIILGAQLGVTGQSTVDYSVSENIHWKNKTNIIDIGRLTYCFYDEWRGYRHCQDGEEYYKSSIIFDHCCPVNFHSKAI